MLLTMDSAADFLGLSKAELYELCRARSRQRHAIPCFKIGKRTVFRRDSLEAWLQKLEEQNAIAR